MNRSPLLVGAPVNESQVHLNVRVSEDRVEGRKARVPNLESYLIRFGTPKLSERFLYSVRLAGKPEAIPVQKSASSERVADFPEPPFLDSLRIANYSGVDAIHHF